MAMTNMFCDRKKRRAKQLVEEGDANAAGWQGCTLTNTANTAVW